MQDTTHHLPRSGKFLPPGSNLPQARLDLVRRTLLDELRAYAGEQGLQLEQGRDPGDHRLSMGGLSLLESCAMAESGLKRLLRCLSADVIGGANVTRLDRCITHSHPRLPYRRAVRIVGSRGWRLNLGEELPLPAEASLIRFCGLLPVQILYVPGQRQPASRPPSSQGFRTIVPWAGGILEATLPAPGAPGEAVFRLRSEGLLQFVLGLPDTLS